MGLTRRDFLRGSGAIAVAGGLTGANRYASPAGAAVTSSGLCDPMIQPLFATPVPNALDPGFVYRPQKGRIKVGVGQSVQMTGIVDPDGTPLATTVWGYGDRNAFTWPGRTFEVRSGQPLQVKWENRLVDPVMGMPLPYLLTGKNNGADGDWSGIPVLDTSLHWAFSLMGYEAFSVATDGVPVVVHVHGGHSDAVADGYPEAFFTPGWTVRGPRWVRKDYVYDNDQPAGTLWYHDHALGITRLNVYAGMAGFYIVRDADDSGVLGNSLGLPAYPYEVALAIQDRFFKDTGELFFPAFPGDPAHDDFITGEGATPPHGQPTALAEFFGDHMLVNGKIWPAMDVERRNYRLRLLNGCDSRFLAVRLYVVDAGATGIDGGAETLPMTVIGGDQGLASGPTEVHTLLIETGARYDVIVDFGAVPDGKRVIMWNLGGDEPFGGGIGEGQVYDRTDRVMAFDVIPADPAIPDVSPVGKDFSGFGPGVGGRVDRTRKVALFEGTDEYGRLQPLLGTAEPATDYRGNPVKWPALPEYANAGLTGQMQGSIAWHSPTTENPALGTTEVWEIWNTTMDAHPVHLHLVHFEVIDRKPIVWDSATTEEDRVLDSGADAAGDGAYLLRQAVVQHHGMSGSGFRIGGVVDGEGAAVDPGAEYVENALKDMVTALPGQITRIKATFDKPGEFVWHCHILSHEDHEMMRVLHVGPGA
jgi:FtsP/CotA-like multicopper oxidase with cupredoxin domain